MKNRLKNIREALNITQKDFSDKIGFAQASYSQIENGVRNINDRTIKLVCQEFNVNEQWLRTGSGSMFNNEGDFIELLASKLDELDEIDRKIFTEYLKLPIETKKAIKDYFMKIFS